jgi:hypothetical protein
MNVWSIWYLDPHVPSGLAVPTMLETPPPLHMRSPFSCGTWSTPRIPLYSIMRPLYPSIKYFYAVFNLIYLRLLRYFWSNIRKSKSKVTTIIHVLKKILIFFCKNKKNYQNITFLLSMDEKINVKLIDKRPFYFSFCIWQWQMDRNGEMPPCRTVEIILL